MKTSLHRNLIMFEYNIGPHNEIVGTIVELVYTNDAYTNLHPGCRGKVVFIDDTGTVHVKWDNGSSLGLLPEYDKWKVIK